MFHNSMGSSNIDLTITNDKLILDIIEWEISTEESLSYHNYLKYNIGVSKPTSKKVKQRTEYKVRYKRVPITRI